LREYANTIVPILGAVRLTKLRPEHISEMYIKTLEGSRRDGRGGGLSPRTVHQVHTMLKQALTQACVWRAIPYNPAALVKPPKVQRKEMKTIDTKATAKMLDAARQTSIYVPILLGFCADYGAGKSVLCAGAMLIWKTDNWLSLPAAPVANMADQSRRAQRPAGAALSHCRSWPLLSCGSIEDGRRSGYCGWVLR
jgi:hypothetical protein